MALIFQSIKARALQQWKSRNGSWSFLINATISYQSYKTQIRLLQENSRVHLKPECIFITHEILFIFARDGTTHWFTPYFNKMLQWLLNFCDHYHELKTTSTIINFMKDLKIRKPVYTGGFTYSLNWKIPHHVLIKWKTIWDSDNFI